MIFSFASDRGQKRVAIDLSFLRRVSLVEDEDGEGFCLIYLSDVEEYKIEFDDESDAKEFYRKLVFEWNLCCDQRALRGVGMGQYEEGGDSKGRLNRLKKIVGGQYQESGGQTGRDGQGGQSDGDDRFFKVFQ